MDESEWDNAIRPTDQQRLLYLPSWTVIVSFWLECEICKYGVKLKTSTQKNYFITTSNAKSLVTKRAFINAPVIWSERLYIDSDIFV
jgi:hypothetical protein